MSERCVSAEVRGGRSDLPGARRRSEPVSTRRTRRRLAVAVAVGAATAVGWYLKARSGVEWDVEMARALVEEMGFWAPGVFVLLVTFRLVFLVPSQVMLTVGGVCFGFLWGTIYGAMGVMLSGVLAFWLARYLGGDALRKRVSPGLRQALDVASRETGGLLVLIGTAYPVGPLTGYHIGAGLARMSSLLYLPALGLGSLIRASLFTYLGSRVAEFGIREAWPAALMLAAFCLPLLHPGARSWVAGRFRGAGEAPSPRG